MPVSTETSTALEPEMPSLASTSAVTAAGASTVLVTGGAGYIGSHTVRALLDAGYAVVVLDDLSSGHTQALPASVPLVQGSLQSPQSWRGLFRQYPISAVIHFAAFIEAGESMRDPARFYHNNVLGSLQLLEVLKEEGISRLVFSSSAGVYGQPALVPIPEDCPKQPVNVYGETKWMIEQVLTAYDRAYALRSLSLRYFNACGADPAGDIGEAHRTKSHLIELALLSLLGIMPGIRVFGTDYPTPDGTAIRDYVHVCDLASAHVVALQALEAGAETRAYNVGSGRGYSVREVLDTIERVTGRTLQRTLEPRRPGDPAILVADAAAIRTQLGWKPRFDTLEQMIQTAWHWHLYHPNGYQGN